MSSRRWLDQLTPTDRQAVELVMYGDSIAAGRLVTPPPIDESIVDTGESVEPAENAVEPHEGRVESHEVEDGEVEHRKAGDGEDGNGEIGGDHVAIDGGETAVPQVQKLQSFGLPERIQAGETLLQSLNLLPKTAQNGELKPRTGVILLRSPTASTVTIVFNGNSRFFTLPPSAVTVADTHILLIRDPNRCFGFFGIPELGEDYPACLDNLNRIIAALAADEVYCVGLSAGGSTAIRVGCDLMARGILGFSVPTTLNLEDDKGAELKHYPQLTRLYRNARHMGIDLVKYYADKIPRPSLILTYSASHIRDSWLALRMDNVPGAELVDTEGFTGHSTYVWLRDNDKLDQLFERLFALTPYGETTDHDDLPDTAQSPYPRLLEGASL